MSDIWNTTGTLKGEVASSQRAASQANPPVDDKNLLESVQAATLQGIDDWVAEQGDNKLAMAGAALASAATQVFMPIDYWGLIPIGKAAKLLKKGAEATGVLKKGERVADAAKDTNKTVKAEEKTVKGEKKAEPLDEGTKNTNKTDNPANQTKGDSQIKRGKKRPAGRCELVPYDELQCGKGQQAHHVIPDWMVRLGKRKGVERIADLPSLAKGPAICLNHEEHTSAHKHNDPVAQRVGKHGRGTGIRGTIKLGDAKGIAARSIEKATKDPKSGAAGCAKEEIQKQLDQHFKDNDKLLRGVKDARKVTSEMRDALPSKSKGKGDI